MTTKSTVFTVSLQIEEDKDAARQVPYELSVQRDVENSLLAALAAILSDRPDVKVEWSSSGYLDLDEASGYGRCAVCNCWVYDAELKDGERRGKVSPGAIVQGRYRCDDHLPTGHPLCFARTGYDGPVPE